ncbi:hypothetical protein EHQ05_16140 [Leptospira yasudae]|uniref:Metal-dependent HD superfamily phosphohydrolase n=1 Tax=Leptospira yasudae TaxID=2202201 RepID=A0ABX9LZJ2_9LEPT|nr:hypothetical protein [Leptospira yasudae]RHX78369.1 hypothetical protein DLM77_18110 [Leptospira yasudae]TGK24449.1 hypothetical protein EHQ05_16140 [Leptospira yasudae]TGM05765.1 hypothetical protein EHQ86_10085 [Leptospira yasudae]
MTLKQSFIQTASRYSSDMTLVESCWNEIETCYCEPHRFYHNLSHLETLHALLSEIKILPADRDCILFTMFYHDVVYDVSKNDNEEQSALLAEKRLREIGFPEQRIASCKSQILATKGHSQSEDPDTNLFTDADLSILGQAENVYEEYYKNIRREYSIYTDDQYLLGRKKVLEYFLGLERIYKTEEFFRRFETQARKNLSGELNEIKKSVR